MLSFSISFGIVGVVWSLSWCVARCTHGYYEAYASQDRGYFAQRTFRDGETQSSIEAHGPDAETVQRLINRELRRDDTNNE